MRVSVMALRALVLLELILGASLWLRRPLAPALTHMAVGILVVALVWFLGLAQATVKGGTLGLTLGTFLGGLALTVVGFAQGFNPGQPALQILHLLLALGVIALGEISAARYRRGKRAVTSPAA